MKYDDFKISLEEKCLDSVRACKKYDFDNAVNRASFLSGYFEEEFPSLSKIFVYIASGIHIDLYDIPFYLTSLFFVEKWRSQFVIHKELYMSKNYKKINFTLDSELIESIMRFVVLPSGMDFSYFVKACFINRCIDKGYLNEFGMPVEFPVPKLDFDNINSFPSWETLARSTDDK